MILSHQDIAQAISDGHINVCPFDSERLQPASLDLTLGAGLKVFKPPVFGDDQFLSVRQDNSKFMTEVAFTCEKPYLLHPWEFALGVIAEHITISAAFVARLEGRSSIGRLAQLVHITAGYVDPGWSGNLTVELCNLSPYPFELEVGMPIAQIAFEQLSSPTDTPYKGRYLGNTQATASRIHEKR